MANGAARRVLIRSLVGTKTVPVWDDLESVRSLLDRAGVESIGPDATVLLAGRQPRSTFRIVGSCRNR